MKDEPIEAVMWRTMRILRVFDRNELLVAVNQTHVVLQHRITRYLNHLLKQKIIFEHGVAQYQVSPNAPSQAPIFRKVRHG